MVSSKFLGMLVIGPAKAMRPEKIHILTNLDYVSTPMTGLRSQSIESLRGGGEELVQFPEEKRPEKTITSPCF